MIYHYFVRNERFKNWVKRIEEAEGLDAFSKSYEKMGFTVEEKDHSITYREWVPSPAITEAFLIGDFNGWDRSSHRMIRNEFGVWSITLPANPNTGDYAIPHNSKVKISMVKHGERIERIPAWITRSVQDRSQGVTYEGVFWNPREKFTFRNASPKKPDRLRIYEAHGRCHSPSVSSLIKIHRPWIVGICTPEGKVASYNEFTSQVLPRISQLGYNAIQLMAIMEHAYYASFGYQVTNFFAASSRYGTPEDLMNLIDTAHGFGIVVLLDVVHSHACKNVLDGLNLFDGTGKGI